jgi:hypothetical protein
VGDETRMDGGSGSHEQHLPAGQAVIHPKAVGERRRRPGLGERLDPGRIDEHDEGDRSRRRLIEA